MAERLPFLFLLERLHTSWDETVEGTVIAKDEDEARKLMCGDLPEDEDDWNDWYYRVNREWLDPEKSTCEKIGKMAEHLESQIVMTYFAAG